jgi:predicted TIM-barrel fold metal-dependent hydrolase
MPALVDAHTHVQPSRATTDLFFGRVGLSRPPQTEGTIDELLRQMDLHDVARTTIVPWLPARDLVASSVEQGTDRDAAIAAVLDEWRALNEWAAAAVLRHPGRLTCLVGVDPLLFPHDALEQEVRARLREGATGIKIAPMYAGARPDDERFEIVWRLAAEERVYVLSACGDNPAGEAEAMALPEHFDAVLRAYPTVILQLAQFGQSASAEIASLTARYENVFTDTALRLGGPETAGEIAELIRRIGVDRVLFGSNYPIVDLGQYAAALRALPLTEDELLLVGSANADRVHSGTL